MERSVLIDTLRQYPMELKNMSFDVQDNEEFVQMAVKKNGLALGYASARLRDDYELVMLAVKKNGLALQFASEALKKNQEIVSSAVCSNGEALQFVPQELQNNRELILSASRNCSAEHIPEQFLSDEEIAWNLIEHDYHAFQYLSEELRKNLDLIIEVIKYDITMFMCVPDEILGDKESVIQLVKINGGALAYISEELKDDKQIALMAMRGEDSPWGYEHLSDNLRYDVDVLREFVEHISLNYDDVGEFINVFDSNHIPSGLLADDVFIRRLAEIYEWTDYCLVLSKDLVLRMIEIGVCDTDILDDEVLDDPEVQEALAQSMYYENECGEED